jgi:hypothetical protein
VDNFHEPSSTARPVPHDPEYYSSAINAKTGRLSPRAYFYASPWFLAIPSLQLAHPWPGHRSPSPSSLSALKTSSPSLIVRS